MLKHILKENDIKINNIMSIWRFVEEINGYAFSINEDEAKQLLAHFAIEEVKINLVYIDYGEIKGITASVYYGDVDDYLMEVFEVHDGSVYNTISIQTPNRSTKKYESHSTVVQDLGNRLVIYHDTPLINIDEIREGGYQDCACCSQNEPDGVTIQSCSTCIDI